MTSDDGSTAFLDRLGTHLERAAAEGAPRTRSPLALVALVALVALGSFGVVISSQRSSEAIVVTVVGQSVEVEVRSPVLDAMLPVRELSAVGVTASVTEVLVPDDFDGRISAVSSLAGNAEIRFDGPNVVSFSVAVGDELHIEIGRGGTADKDPVASEADSVCSRWRNKPTSAVLSDIEATVDTVRWQLYDGTVVREIEIPPPESFIQNAILIDRTTALVVLGFTPEALPKSPTCQPDS